jgi:hypothetical protein
VYIMQTRLVQQTTSKTLTSSIVIAMVGSRNTLSIECLLQQILEHGLKQYSNSGLKRYDKTWIVKEYTYIICQKT